MNKKMTARALAGRCGGRGDRGSAADARSSSSSEARARLPKPQKDVRRKSRRVCGKYTCAGMVNSVRSTAFRRKDRLKPVLRTFVKQGAGDGRLRRRRLRN